MQFEYTPPQTEYEKTIGGFRCINAFGTINEGDDLRFLDLLAKNEVPVRTDVYINSNGGDVETAIALGRSIRDPWFATHVGQYVIDDGDNNEFMKRRKELPGKCLSAATLIYLGGRLRYFSEESQFGVHQFSFRNPSPANVGRSQMLSAKIARYVSDMGISAEFLELSSAAEGSKIEFVPLEELTRLGVVTGGQTSVDWSVHSQGGALYVRGERDNLFGHHKIILAYTKPEGFLLHAVIESQGREWELSSFPLVELIIGENDDTPIDVSARSSRKVFGSYTNITTSLSKDEAKAIAYSKAFGLRVRWSNEAPLFLGIAPISTLGGELMLQNFYEMLA